MTNTSEHRSVGNRGQEAAFRVLLVVSGAVFFAEFGLEFLMNVFPLPLLAKALLVSFVLSTIVFLLLLVLLVRPFRRYENEIERHRQQLETRVADRTRELARFAAILDATPDFVATADANLQGIWLNAGGRQMIGMGPRDSSTGMDILLAYPERLRPAMHTAIENAIEAGSWRGESVMLRRAGGEVPVSKVILAHRAPGGELEFLSTIARDTSEQHRQEADIERVNAELRAALDRVEAQSREIGLLAEMGDLVQAAVDPKEVFAIIGRYTQDLLQADSGAVYVYSASRNDLECALGWGGIPSAPVEQAFGPSDCWALRRGRSHARQVGSTAPMCMHLAADHAPSTLCVPMMAHGDVVGLLHLRHGSGPVDPRLPGAIADQVALSIANLKLRDTLRSQSIRDPVTSLFNRRYLEETLEREIRRAARGRQSIGLILIDLDRFKLLNDTHGHQAGDLVLQDCGAFLNRSIRGGDVACRYGGEEFVLVLPESTLTSTAARAESLRAEFRTVRFTFAGQPIGPVTFSAGVAAYPDHGATASDLLSAADGALYQSKRNGRDRITTADVPAPEPEDGTSPE